MASVRVRGSVGVAIVLCVLLGGLFLFSGSVQAGDVRVSSLTESPDRVDVTGAWVAWDDYSVDPGVVRWQNLDTGAEGTVLVPGLLGRKGTSWAVGERFIAWDVWSEGQDGGLFVENLNTGEQRKIAAQSDDLFGFVTEGSFIYWIQGNVLHCLNERTEATSTYPAPADVAAFDVGGGWISWVEYEEAAGDGVEGHVYARNLVTGVQLTLGPIIWANLSGTLFPPQLSADGDWVVWYSDKSFNEDDWGDTTAFAYNLETRTRISLDDRMGAETDPATLEVAGDWIAWSDNHGNNLRSYIMDLADPAGVPVPVSKTPGFQYRVALRDGTVAWLDNRQTEYGFMVYTRADSSDPAPAFSDIADSGYELALEDLAAANIIGGYSDGTFRPGDTVLRAQFAKMLVAGLKLEVDEGAESMPFQDVGRPTDNLYPDDYIATAYKNGIVGGFSASIFGPYRPVTRLQMISMVVRALERLRPGRLVQPQAGWDGYQYAEASDPTHGANVRLAECNGLLSSWIPYEWSLYEPATRGEMAQMLWQALGGELDPRWDGLTSSVTLDQIETQLISKLAPAASIYLPSQLPTGWTVARLPLPVDAEWQLSENPQVDSGNSPTAYRLAFTDGSSVVTLWTSNDLADPGQASTANLPTDLRFEGADVGMLYVGGVPAAFSFTTGSPRGWILVGSKPWDRASVLEFAEVMRRVR
jgi:hypothetical protein